MVKNHSESDRKYLLPPLHGLLLFIISNILLYALSTRLDNTYQSAYYTSRVALAETRSDPSHHERELNHDTSFLSVHNRPNVRCYLLLFYLPTLIKFTALILQPTIILSVL